MNNRMIAHLCNFIVGLTGNVLYVINSMLVVSVVERDRRFDSRHCTSDGLTYTAQHLCTSLTAPLTAMKLTAYHSVLHKTYRYKFINTITKISHQKYTFSATISAIVKCKKFYNAFIFKAHVTPSEFQSAI